MFGELLRLDDFIDEAPVFGALAADAVGIGAEHVGVIAADFALVGHAREAAGAGQNAEQRKFGEADGGRAIVDEDDVVAGEREFVAAAGGRAVERGEKFQAGVCAGVFDSVARFIGEFAEVHFPRVGAEAEHVNVCAGAEDAIFRAGDDDGANFGMLEADALERVVEFDVDAKIVGVELEFVAGAQAAVFGDVHGERGDGRLEGEAPVFVARWVGAVVDRLGLRLRLSLLRRLRLLCVLDSGAIHEGLLRIWLPDSLWS